MHEKRYAELKAALDQLVLKLIAEYQPEKIILYGSTASGDVHEWSDLDLVVIKETDVPFIRRGVEVAQLCPSPVGTQYLVYTPEEFEQMIAEDNIFIVDEVIGKGKVLYEREPVRQSLSSDAPHFTDHVPRAERIVREARPKMESSYPRRWLDKAADDLGLARLGLKEGYTSHACFLSQQCIEKSLKAYLIAKARQYPRVHILGNLLTMCESRDPTFSQFREACDTVDVYYMPTRYPNGEPGSKPTGNPTTAEAGEAIAAAERILQFVTQKLSAE